jgi:hypothetical protein
MYGYSYGYANAGQQADSTLNDFELRVIADSGTDASVVHSGDVFRQLNTLSLLSASSLVCTCSAGKVSVLYSYTLITS